MNIAALHRETAVSRLVGELKAIAGLKGRDLANILGVSPPTVTRWSKGEADPTIDKQTAMAQLRWVAARLAEFYEPDEVRLWLQSPHPQLSGLRPYDLIVENRTAEVLEIIERLDSGVYLQVDRRRALDDRLLDLVGGIDGVPYEGPMWRVVRRGRDVLDGSRGSGRWNTSEMSVLYGAAIPDGAISEIHFHLSRGQSVFPSRMQHDLFALSVKAQQTLMLADMDQLRRLGVEDSRYRELLYDRTQEIAAAASFLGFDGLIAPSARWECQNIVLFLDAIDLEGIRTISSAPVDWKAWRQGNS